MRSWKTTAQVDVQRDLADRSPLRNFANFRKRRPDRQDQTVIVIDPAVRFEAKRPVINYGDEIRCNNIKDP